MNPYNPNLWDTTTHVNPTLMNNIEQGVANSCLSDSLGKVEQGDTSTSIYQIGEYFIFKGQRVKATSTIAVGDTLEVGTNCEKIDIQTDIENIQTDVGNIDLTNGGTIHGDLNVTYNNTATTMTDSNLRIGNNIPEGTTGCSRGVLRIFDKNQYNGVMLAGDGALTGDRYYVLPNKNGTVALTNDILPSPIKMTGINGSNDSRQMTYQIDSQSLYLMTLGAVAGYGSMLCQPSIYLVWRDTNGGTDISYTPLYTGSATITSATMSNGNGTFNFSSNARTMIFKLANQQS